MSPLPPSALPLLLHSISPAPLLCRPATARQWHNGSSRKTQCNFIAVSRRSSPAVTLSPERDHAVTLDNGIVSMTLDVRNATMLTYVFRGVSLLETSATAYDIYEKNAGHMGAYFSSNTVAAGVSQYWNPINCSYLVVTQTAEMVEVVLSTAGAQFFEHEFHFVLRRGDCSQFADAVMTCCLPRTLAVGDQHERGEAVASRH